jgi:hypothetical protein
VNRGDVLFIPAHEFPDGGRSDKLLILMNDPANASGNLYLVLTTSQQKGDLRQLTPEYCQPKRREFFFPAKRFFPKDTWALLNRAPFIVPKATIDAKLSNKRCGVVNTISPDVINAIKNCIEKHCADDLNREECNLLGIKFKG